MEVGSLFRSDWAVSAGAAEPSRRRVTRPAEVFWREINVHALKPFKIDGFLRGRLEWLLKVHWVSRLSGFQDTWASEQFFIELIKSC